MIDIGCGRVDVAGEVEHLHHWIHAHTKDSRWRVDGDIREMWAAEVAERTPLTAADLVEGAVDVAWFNDVIREVSKDNWQTLLKQAKFASGGRRPQTGGGFCPSTGR